MDSHSGYGIIHHACQDRKKGRAEWESFHFRFHPIPGIMLNGKCVISDRSTSIKEE